MNIRTSVQTLRHFGTRTTSTSASPILSSSLPTRLSTPPPSHSKLLTSSPRPISPPPPPPPPRLLSTSSPRCFSTFAPPPSPSSSGRDVDVGRRRRPSYAGAPGPRRRSSPTLPPAYRDWYVATGYTRYGKEEEVKAFIEKHTAEQNETRRGEVGGGARRRGRGGDDWRPGNRRLARAWSGGPLQLTVDPSPFPFLVGRWTTGRRGGHR